MWLVKAYLLRWNGRKDTLEEGEKNDPTDCMIDYRLVGYTLENGISKDPIITSSVLKIKRVSAKLNNVWREEGEEEEISLVYWEVTTQNNLYYVL